MMKRLFLTFIFIFSTMSFSGGLGQAQSEGEMDFFADFLYWHASEQPTATWASVVNISNLLRVDDFTASNVYFAWRPGIRVGFGYKPPNFWDTRVFWTYYGTKARESIVPASGNVILPEFFNGFTSGNFFFSADLAWDLTLNIIDFEVGHRFNIGDSLSIRPFVGVKGASIKQSIYSVWDADIYRASENLRNNFYGVGPSFGINTEWMLFKNLSLLGDFSTAFMWGSWHIKDVYQRPQALLVTPTVITSDINHSKLGTFMFRLFTGLQWTHQGRAQVSVKAGYEMQMWPSQLRMPTFQQLPVSGDLTFQGGTCGIHIKV